MGYNLYLYEKNENCAKDNICLPDNMTISHRKPSLGLLIKKEVTLNEFLWSIISFNRYNIYYVKNERDVIVHKSAAIGKCFKFPFLNKNEFEIGPCYTIQEYRGLGIYPNVLKYIIKNNSSKNFYMLVHNTNVSSIRGIEKASFRQIGYIKKNKIGQWRIQDGLDISK